MLICGNNNLGQLASCLATAHNFLLSAGGAAAIFESLIATIERNSESVCDEAELSEVDRNLLWRRQFLSPVAVIVA